MRIGQLMGDRSGMIHAGGKQTFGYTRVNVYQPVNVVAYRYVCHSFFMPCLSILY